MTDIHADRVLILDFGSQYTQLIARRVRELGVYCEILPWDVDPAEIRRRGAKALILSGGPESVYDAKGPAAPREAFAPGIPVLGICYGMQTMAAQLGGRVESSSHREFGYAQVRPAAGSRLLDGLEDARDPSGARLLDVWMSHGDRVVALPPGFQAIASTESAPFAAMADESRCSSIPRSRTRCRAARSCGASCTRSPVARPGGRRPRSSRTPSRGYAPRWAPIACSSACPAASIRRCSPRSCTARSAIS